MLIAIRVDASFAVGLGHLRRCLSLAQTLRSLGAEVRFGLRNSDVDGVSLAAEEGFSAHALGDGMDPEADAHTFCSLWSDERPDWVIVDHYDLDARWHAAVRARLNCLVAAIDDLADRPLDVDALVDPNLAAKDHRDKYSPVLRRPPALWLCGPRFALLGPSYAQAPAFEVAACVRSIGIFLGGTDPAGLTATALQACREVAQFAGPIEIVTTTANARLGDLERLAAGDPDLTLSTDLPELSAFYRRHDLQIGAGGGATWERCCVGAPALTLCTADNQRAVIPALQAVGALATSARNDVQSIGSALVALIESRAARHAMSEVSRALVDGQGATRTALALLGRCPAGMGLRGAGHADAAMMWRWRDDLATRSASRQDQSIPFETHQAWLDEALSNPQRRLRIANVGLRDVGVIRFDRMDAGTWEVSLYLDPSLHGLGLGAAMLRQGEADLLAGVGPVTVHAEVLATNPASFRLFVAAGYSRDGPMTFSKALVARSGAAASMSESHR